MTQLDYSFITREADQAGKEARRMQFASAFSHLRAAAAVDPAIARDAEALEARYFYMLRFIAQDNAVADLKDTLSAIAGDFGVLVERIRLTVVARSESSMLGGALRFASLRPEESLETLVSDYLAELDRLRTDTAALTDTSRRKTLERFSSDIFNRIWIEFPISEDAARLLESIITDSSLPEHDRAAWVNAVGLNLQRYPTSSAQELLLAVHACDEVRLSADAGVWLLLAMRRNAMTPAAKNIAMASVPARMQETHPGDVADILLEWTRSLGTEKMSDEMKSLLENNIRRLGRHFTDRIKDLDPEKYDEALMNSEWLTDGIGSQGFDSIKKFAEAQQRGDDVFMATIGKMRGFDFFNTMANWFLPFHSGHSALAPVVDGEGAAVADMISRMPMLCDSDKFALILSMAQAPEGMRANTLAAMSQQMMGMAASEELDDMLKAMNDKPRRAAINNSIKNIYRFFKLFRAASEFSDTLSQAPLNELFAYVADVEPERLGEIADTLFNARRYNLAYTVYRTLDGSLPLAGERRQKYAFAAEISDCTDEACDIYNAIIAEEPSNMWAAMRLASLEISRKNASHAVELLEPFADTETGNAEYLGALASAYIHADRWDDAVNIYHNIDYILPDDDKSADSDLAWALTVCGDYDAAYQIFSGITPDVSALRRQAVLLWLMGKHRQAVEVREKAEKLADSTPAGEEDALYTQGLLYMALNNPAADSLDLIDEIMRYRRYGSSFGSIF